VRDSADGDMCHVRNAHCAGFSASLLSHHMNQNRFRLKRDEWGNVVYLNETTITSVISLLCITDNENFKEEITSGRRGNKVVSVLKHVETVFFQIMEYI